MPFEAHTLQYLEDALSECFEYHDALDQFLTRSGVSEEDLEHARKIAEQRKEESPHDYNRAPKRFVVQEILKIFASGNKDGEYVISSLINNVSKGKFLNATDSATIAGEHLVQQFQNDKKQKEEEKRVKEEEARLSRRTEERKIEERSEQRISEKLELRTQFTTLITEDNAQKRGYMFEKFLNKLFEHERLSPRSPFRITGEQIDGSFTWRNQTHLVEAKWVKIQ